MNKIRNIWLLVFCICNLSLFANNNTDSLEIAEEEIHPELRFQMYIDTIETYLYRSNTIVEETIAKCDKILQSNTTLSDSIQIVYCIKRINYHLNYNRPLDAYQLIVDHEALSQTANLHTDLKQRFSYLKAYTLMILHDYDEAQKVFYNNLETAKINRDTYSIASTLYSLGQLYGDKEDYDSAIACYSEVVKLKDNTSEIPASTITLVDFELSNIHYALENWDKADKIASRGLAFAKEKGINLLVPYFLSSKAKIALERKQTKKAENLAQEVQALALANGDDRTIKLAQNLQASVFKHKGNYQDAIETLQKTLSETDSTQINERLEIYNKLHEIYSLMHKPTKAYESILQYNSIKEEKEVVDRKEKTAFLKIKFETEQQKATNQLLAIQVKQGQNEKKILYLVIALFALGILGLYAAFYQKRKYNKTLEKEVKRRTDELNQTNSKLTKRNSELDEFNRILAHDLREPLRSVVSFSQLAKGKSIANSERNEYINLIEKSGRQLHQIINDIGIYREVAQEKSTTAQLVNTKNLIQQIKTKIQANYPEKDIKISSKTLLPSILTQAKVLQTVLEQLIDNGIKYNENKSVQLAIQYNRTDTFHIFDITDNGMGIASEFHEKIFGMCKRLHTRDVYIGSGLGLSITQKTLENNGGQISLLHSIEGKGSTFRVELPLV